MKIFGIKDTKMGIANIFTAKNNETAKRILGEMVRDVNSLVSKYQEDYELYALGEMNDDTGEIASKVEFVERATAYSALREQALGEQLVEKFKKLIHG